MSAASWTGVVLVLLGLAIGLREQRPDSVRVDISGGALLAWTLMLLGAGVVAGGLLRGCAR